MNSTTKSVSSTGSSVLVADAGPLIGLARIDALWVLEQMVDQVIVPEGVADECCTDVTRPGAQRIEGVLSKPGWSVERRVPDRLTLPPALGVGERFAIELAHEIGCPVLVDDLPARRAARHHNVPVLGTGGLLLAAKRRGILDEVGPQLEQLRRVGYRLSDRLVAELCRRAGESEAP